MPKLTDISYVKKLMEENDLTFLKKYGQNFLVNESVPVRTAELCEEDKSCGVIEIGPGIGTLTYQLAERFKKVLAVEIDTRLLPVLDITLGEFDNVTVINGDIMDFDINELIKEHFDGMDVCVCANLPYYITTPIITNIPEGILIGFLLGFGALLGDALGSFLKRRLGIGRGKPAPILDQLDFIIVALILVLILILDF